jgi:RimJ/RimL family protein N-acetyltransferase
MQTEADSEGHDEFDEEEPQRPPMEFRGSNGLVLRELVSVDDAEEMLGLINANRDTFAEFAPELNNVQTVLGAIERIGDGSFSTYGLRTAANQPLAGILTIAQETDDLVSLGYAVGKDFQRQGIASEAIKTISEHYLQIPGINTVRCYVKPKNHANRRLLLQCGFHEAGGTPYKNVFYELNKPTTPV